MYMCARGIDFASVSIILELFRHCGIFYFSFYIFAYYLKDCQKISIADKIAFYE